MESNFSKKRNYSSAKKTWSSKRDFSEESSDDLSEEDSAELAGLSALLKALLEECRKLNMALTTMSRTSLTME